MLGDGAEELLGLESGVEELALSALLIAGPELGLASAQVLELLAGAREVELILAVEDDLGEVSMEGSSALSVGRS